MVQRWYIKIFTICKYPWTCTQSFTIKGVTRTCCSSNAPFVSSFGTIFREWIPNLAAMSCGKKLWVELESNKMKTSWSLTFSHAWRREAPWLPLLPCARTYATWGLSWLGCFFVGHSLYVCPCSPYQKHLWSFWYCPIPWERACCCLCKLLSPAFN